MDVPDDRWAPRSNVATRVGAKRTPGHRAGAFTNAFARHVGFESATAATRPEGQLVSEVFGPLQRRSVADREIAIPEPFSAGVANVAVPARGAYGEASMDDDEYEILAAVAHRDGRLCPGSPDHVCSLKMEELGA